MTFQEAKEMGRAAFHNGLKAAPALDKDFMAKLSRLNATNELLAWHEGWAEENLPWTKPHWSKRSRK